MTPLFLIGYLIGSIPFGFILAKLAGHGDIRQIGSGNIGATNVLRTGNKFLAVITLLLDAGKGAAVILLIYSHSPQTDSLTIILAGFGAIIGHCFPIWLKFKGGKGVATALGTLLAAVPFAGLAACGTWLLSAFIFRISSLAALIAMVIAPVVTFFVYDAKSAIITTMIAALVFFLHKDNIKRLMKGEEPKIGKKQDG